jgi:crotonobetainyl-CoA:carnitine CoA-transferase CaiB-like acyl-CoA transferase
VLDLTRLLPGPVASLILADLGARVDKLEDPAPGDYLRAWPPFRGDTSGTYLALNRDKRSVVVDLKKPAGQALMRRMLASYDVLLEGFRPGVLARLGLAPEALAAEHPELIVCSISGYGQTGPLAQRAGHDLNYLARAGVLGVTGPEAEPPAVPGVQMADVAGGGLWAVLAILGALVERARTGRGAVLDTAMCEGAMALASFALGAYFTDGVGLPRGASALDGGLGLYNTYRTRDGGYVALGALEPKFWAAFAQHAGLDPSLEAVLPGPHQQALKEKLTALFAERTRAEWEAFAAAHDCCLEPVLAPSELAEDPQHKARGVFFPLPTPDGGTMLHLRTPTATREVHSPARDAGADTDAVLADAGLTPDEIAALRSAYVVR